MPRFANKKNAAANNRHRKPKVHIKKKDPILVDGKLPRPMFVDYKDVELLKKLTNLLNCFVKKIEVLDKAVVGAKEIEDVADNAMYFKESVLSAMQELRAVADEMESNMSAKAWPYPSYGTMLFSV